MATKVTIAELDINTDALLRSATNTKKILDQLKESQKQLKKSSSDTTAAQVKNEVQIKRLNAQYTEQKNVLVSLNSINQDFVKTEKAINNAVNKNITSIQQARNNNKELLKIRNQLNLQTKAGQKELTKINAKLDQNNEFIKENVDQYTKQKINIGNYEGALRSVFPQLSRMVGVLKTAKEGLIAQRAAQNASTVATSAGSKAMKLFRLALISTGIGAIVVALGSLVTFLTKTQRGVDAVSKVMAGLGAAISVITDRISAVGEAFTKLFSGGGIVAFFSDVKEAASGLGDEMLREIEIAVALEQALNDLADREIGLIGIQAQRKKEVEELRILAKDELTDLKTRASLLEQAQQLERDVLADQLQVAKERARISQEQLDLGESTRDEIKANAELQAEVINLETQSLKLQRTLEAEKQSLLKRGRALDVAAAAKREAQRIKDNEADKKAEEDRIELKIDNAERELEIFKKVHKQKIDSETFFTEELLVKEQERLDAIATKQIAFEEKRLLEGVITEQEYLDAIALIQDEHQIGRDDAQILRDKAKADQRVVDLDNQREIDELNFQTDFELQSSRLEQQRLQEIAAAEKSGASITLINKKYAKLQLIIDDNLQMAKRQALVDTLGVIKGVIGEETALGKAVGIAQALINTYQGIAAGVKLGYPAAIPAVAAAAATGFGAVAKISGIDASFYEGGQVPNGTGGVIRGQNIPTQQGGDNILATVKSGEVILNEEQQSRAGGSEFFKSIGVPGFQTGGQVPSNLGTPIAQGQLTQSGINDLASQINNIQTVLVVEDVSDLQGTQIEVREEANI